MAKKKDYILRSKAIKAVTGWDTEPTDEELELALMDIPVADVAPVRRGRWVEIGVLYSDTRGLFYGKMCSVCNEISDYKSHYCPNCGARMEG